MGSILNLTGSGIREITARDTPHGYRCYALWIEVAGDLVFVADDGQTQTITLPVGEFPIRCTQVNTGTTATVWAILNSAG